VTAATAPAGRGPSLAAPDRVTWRRLTGVTWRQHRIALGAATAVFGLAAVALAIAARLTHGLRDGGIGFVAVSNAVSVDVSLLLLQLAPVVAGVVLGAPLLAREYETRTTSMTWTQSASRGQWLIGQVVPVAVAVAVLAAAVGTGFWLTVGPQLREQAWSAAWFDIGPLPYAGWTLIAFALGVFLGALTRRTLPAVAATIGCYAVLAGFTAGAWRPFYLPPAQRLDAAVPLTSGGSFFTYWHSAEMAPDYLGIRYTWPDGRPVSAADQLRSVAWLNAHHIRLVMLYQPGSRFFVFQAIEFGWLTIVSAILILAALLLIRQRAA
jgi:ABC-2 family transporter protein